LLEHNTGFGFFHWEEGTAGLFEEREIILVSRWETITALSGRRREVNLVQLRGLYM
jgi:hypothetical protein